MGEEGSFGFWVSWLMPWVVGFGLAVDPLASYEEKGRSKPVMRCRAPAGPLSGKDPVQYVPGWDILKDRPDYDSQDDNGKKNCKQCTHCLQQFPEEGDDFSLPGCFRTPENLLTWHQPPPIV